MDDGLAAPASIGIRPATLADVGELARLRWEFRAAHAPPRESETVFRRRCRDWMRRRLRDDRRWRAWVAADGEAIVGTVWAGLLEKMPNPSAERERHGYVTNLYVVPAARGGVGGRLLATALEWLASRDVDEVLLWPTERSRSLYARFGFAPSSRHLAFKRPR